MTKRTRYASLIMSGMIITGSVCGCGSSAGMDAAQTSTYDTTESGNSYNQSSRNTGSEAATAPAAADNYCEEATCTEATIECEDAACVESKGLDATCNLVAGYTDTCNQWFPRYEYNTESYDKPDENGFNLTTAKPLSTFAADVDTASYANIRRMIEDGYTLSDINASAVRPEEFINYFSYDLNDPKGGDKFGITTEITTCPWNSDHELMFVGMKTQDIDLREAPLSNLVFLIDVSGSMSDDDKLPLLQKSFKELVNNLPDKGKISIVTYSGNEKVVLSGESMANKSKINDAIDSLEASGCTNGEAGIQKAYEIAKNNYIDGGINRVILATDGDLNVGISSPAELERFIKGKKDDGIFLSVLGFGDGNLKDDNLEKLADCGNGNYSYIDSTLEGKKVLIDEMGSTLVTVAKDVKLQVEFNPQRVNAYRLIGYENRMMDDVDFNDDSKDGGEIGAGHSVVALYEIVPQGSKSAITLKYQNTNGENDTDDKKNENRRNNDKKDMGTNESAKDYSNEYATVSVRYKEPEADKSQLFSVVVDDSFYNREGSENIRFAGMVAEFAMILGDSEFKGSSTLTDIMDSYKLINTRDEYRDEFNQLVRMVAKRG